MLARIRQLGGHAVLHHSADPNKRKPSIRGRSEKVILIVLDFSDPAKTFRPV